MLCLAGSSTIIHIPVTSATVRFAPKTLCLSKRPFRGGLSKEPFMMNPKIILSPIDFSDSSLEALDVASDIASRYGSAIVLVHVVPFIPKLPSDVSMLHEGDYERGLIGDAKQRLSDLAAKLKEKGITARTAVGLANDAAMEILRTQIWPKNKRLTVSVLVHNTTATAFWRTVGYQDYCLTLEIMPGRD